MRIVAWNVAHAARPREIDAHTKPRAIKPGFQAALESFDADVVILTEYVAHVVNDSVQRVLRDIDYKHFEIPTRISTKNQVLIAARTPLMRGELTGPKSGEDDSRTNFSHVRCANLDIVGLRAPSYRPAAKREYWAELAAQIRESASRPIVFIGDLNADPEDPENTPGAVAMRALLGEGWQIPRPRGEYSYRTKTRIDHIIASPSIRVTRAEYVVTHGDHLLCGPKGAVSDHAPLVVEVQL